MIDWILRFFKGTLIGTGFILPGVSGGALAAIFGLYHKIISFIAHIKKDFIQNVLFFIPVGLGALFGMFLLAQPLDYLLVNFKVYVIWGFIGCIIGVFPSLWKEAGKEGRLQQHYIILILTSIIGFILLFMAEKYFQTSLHLNIITWFFAGFLIAVGILVPGMSPSNFLVYLNMYQPMVVGFKTFDLLVLIPLFTGAFTCLFLLSSLVDYLLKRVYGSMFHFVVGIVIASTLMIIPRNFNYLSFGVFLCFTSMLVGTVLGWWMSKLEDKYKKKS